MFYYVLLNILIQHFFGSVTFTCVRRCRCHGRVTVYHGSIHFCSVYFRNYIKSGISFSVIYFWDIHMHYITKQRYQYTWESWRVHQEEKSHDRPGLLTFLKNTQRTFKVGLWFCIILSVLVLKKNISESKG